MNQQEQEGVFSQRLRLLRQGTYVPWQPGFEQFTPRYQGQLVLPGEAVSGLIADYYEIAGEHFTQQHAMATIPDGCTDFIFTLTHGVPKSYVSASVRELRSFQFQDPELIFGVRFMPGATCRLFQTPVCQMVHHPAPMESVLREGLVLQNRIAGAAGFQERRRLANQFILKHLREASGKERILDYCTRRIFETHGNIPLKRLGEETGYSERYLNQLFDLYTGLSPKSMCHVIRIQYAYLLMESRPELSLSAVAQAAGYADHSHMNREFHRFLNASAGVLRKEQLPSGTGKNIVFE